MSKSSAFQPCEAHEIKSQEMILYDGRKVEYFVFGQLEHPQHNIVYLHGFPYNPPDEGPFFHILCEKLGIRLFMPLRPGYGNSSPWHESRLWTRRHEELGHHPQRLYVADLAYFVCQLDLQEFGIIGTSGGGSYALCAASALQSEIESFWSHSKSTSPLRALVFAPKLTAVGVASGSQPWYLRERLHKIRFDKRLAKRLKMRDFSYEWLMDGLSCDETSLRENLKLDFKPEQIDGFLDECVSFLRDCPSTEDAWGFELSSAGSFVAKDGRGIRYWNGTEDLDKTPVRYGRALAKEVGGAWKFKILQGEGHGFSWKGWLEVLIDLSDAMEDEIKTTAKEMSQ